MRPKPRKRPAGLGSTICGLLYRRRDGGGAGLDGTARSSWFPGALQLTLHERRHRLELLAQQCFDAAASELGQNHNRLRRVVVLITGSNGGGCDRNIRRGLRREGFGGQLFVEEFGECLDRAIFTQQLTERDLYAVPLLYFLRDLGQKEESKPSSTKLALSCEASIVTPESSSRQFTDRLRDQVLLSLVCAVGLDIKFSFSVLVSHCLVARLEEPGCSMLGTGVDCYRLRRLDPIALSLERISRQRNSCALCRRQKLCSSWTFPPADHTVPRLRADGFVRGLRSIGYPAIEPPKTTSRPCSIVGVTRFRESVRGRVRGRSPSSVSPHVANAEANCTVSRQWRVQYFGPVLALR